MEKLEKMIGGLSEEELIEVRDMLQERLRKGSPVRLEIPYKFPSYNTYINECRKNKYAGAKMKKQIQQDIGYFINKLPRFDKPVRVEFTWIEANKRRDYDNICASRKFILDALVEHSKLKDDNRNCVIGFKDNFEYGDDWKVILEIREVGDEEA